MRDIKFRWWNGQRMIENHDLQVLARNLNNIDCLMQFTGLKDKNGIPVFEGDILAIDGDIIAPVTYEDGSFQLIALREQGRSPLIQDRAKRMEIVGNVFENSELLESDV